MSIKISHKRAPAASARRKPPRTTSRGRPPRGLETKARTTVALPASLMEAMDRSIREGYAPSRNALLSLALERELWRQEQEAIDASFAAAFADPELQALDDQIMKEFEGIDREGWAMLDDEYGPELAE